MNKTILSIVVGVVFFLALPGSYSNANVCTISENNFNVYRKISNKELVTISNETDQCKFNPTDNYYIRDTYRTRNLNIRSERRRIIVDGKEQERRVWVRIDDKRKGRLTRSESLPNIRRERIRNARERDIDIRGILPQRALERNGRKILEHRSDERIFRREVRDRQYDVQINRDNTDKRSRTEHTRQNGMVVIKDKDEASSWPFSNFVQSAIGVLGLYYFGMHSKNIK
ncbi:ACYPI002718 protein [Aphis craccivora]|uniref:ACYPI002718 protein n=1 Tax=Aphis craccivora TaxID=307492 RepID=A0A6G0YSG6_APHCR|nr:ACYPI002718 protein [Aphis craccivora]